MNLKKLDFLFVLEKQTKILSSTLTFFNSTIIVQAFSSDRQRRAGCFRFSQRHLPTVATKGILSHSYLGSG